MIEIVEVSGKQKKNVCSAAVRRTRAFANPSPAREVSSLGAGGLHPHKCFDICRKSASNSHALIFLLPTLSLRQKSKCLFKLWGNMRAPQLFLSRLNVW